MEMYSKNPFKQINSTNLNSENVSESDKWAKNTYIVLEHIRKQIPQSTGHCSSRKRIVKNVKCQGRLASLGKPSQPHEVLDNACLGIVSDGVIISPDPAVQTRAMFIAALADKFDRGENPFDSSPRDGQSIHRTSIASLMSGQMNFPTDNIEKDKDEKCISDLDLQNQSENEDSKSNDKRASSCEPVVSIYVDIIHDDTTERSFSCA